MTTPTDAPLPPPDPKAVLKAETAAESAALREALVRVTPKVFVTPILVAACVGVYAYMVAKGVNPMTPTVQSLIDWGANYGPKTTSGEWWRLGSAVFLHAGALHLAFNMLVLLQIGLFVERLFGNLAFLAVYLVAGLAGSLASTFAHGEITSVGASGAIFGVYGALVGFLVLNRNAIPSKALKQLLQGALIFIGYNVIYSAGHPEIDQAAHLGGLAGGFLCGLVMPEPFSAEGAAKRVSRGLTVLALGLLGTAGAMSRATPQVDLEGEIRDFAKVEAKVIKTYNDLVKRAKKNDMTDAKFAEGLEHDILPPWNASRARLADLTGLTKQQEQKRDGLLEYMDARLNAWTLFDEGLRTGNKDKIEAYQAADRKADGLLKALTDKYGDKK